MDVTQGVALGWLVGGPLARKAAHGTFVSHSHRDLEKVRPIRNELERRGHHPLLFFLKCLQADDARLEERMNDE